MIINRVRIIKVKHKPLHSEARKEAARLWNDVVRLHKYIRKHSIKNPDYWKWPSCNTFQKHFKGKYILHSQSIQAIIQKFFANVDTALKNRKAGNKRARLPHKTKKYFNPIFKGQSIKVINNRIRLPLKNKRYIWATIPDINGKIVQVELGYNRLCLTIQTEKDIPNNTSTKTAGIDVGLIHTAVITDGVNSLGIVGRGIRSIKQGHAKQLAKLSRKISKTKKGSIRRRKLLRAKYKLIDRKDNLIRNALHHVSKRLVEFCSDNSIKTVAIGKLDNINKNTKKKRRKQCNQEIGLMEFGKLYDYLNYKLKEEDIEIKKISEAYTSQTCPVCGTLNKPNSRKYKCKECSYEGIRDLVGASNIRNLFVNKEIKSQLSIPPQELKYLRPVKLRRSSKPLTPAKVA